MKRAAQIFIVIKGLLVYEEMNYVGKKVYSYTLVN